MIITVTPNPAVDQTLFVDRLDVDDVNRFHTSQLDRRGRRRSAVVSAMICGSGRVPAWARVCIVLGIAAIFSVCFIIIKAGLVFAPPLLFATLRTLIAGLALLGLMIALRQRRCCRRASTGSASSP